MLWSTTPRLSLFLRNRPPTNSSKHLENGVENLYKQRFLPCQSLCLPSAFVYLTHWIYLFKIIPVLNRSNSTKTLLALKLIKNGKCTQFSIHCTLAGAYYDTFWSIFWAWNTDPLVSDLGDHVWEGKTRF